MFFYYLAFGEVDHIVRVREVSCVMTDIRLYFNSDCRNSVLFAYNIVANYVSYKRLDFEL